MINNKTTNHKPKSSFMFFVRHFLHYCYYVRVLLGMHFLIVILAGIIFAYCEEIPTTQGIYFSLITSTTVGFGDITPQTGVGQIISVFLALLGTVLFGLVVAVATYTFKKTVNEYIEIKE
jgi:voltage-gated potassium channel